MGVRWVQVAAIAVCLIGGCKPKPIVDLAKVRGELQARFPERRFAQWNGESGTVSFKAQLTNLGVYSVQINRNGRTCTAVAKYQSTAADKIAPVIYVSAFDGAGKEIGRWDIVKHTLADLGPGATDTTEDFFTLPEGAEPILMAVDDDAQRKESGVEASREQTPIERKPPVLAPGERPRGTPGDDAPDPATLREERTRGKKPVPSKWDGITPEVNAYLKATLKDYESLELVECSVVATYGTDAWAQRVKYRAKNSFGAKNLEEHIFVIRDGAVISVL